MSLSFSSNWTRLVLEFALVLVNGIMALVLYVDGANQFQAGYMANHFQSVSQFCLLLGLVTVGVVATVIGRILGPSSKVMLMLGLTVWNQAWLAAFVACMIPFRLF